MLLIKMLSVSGHSLDTEAKKNENILSGLPSESKKKKKSPCHAVGHWLCEYNLIKLKKMHFSYWHQVFYCFS